MANDIKAIENNFVNSMGSGVAATAHLLELIKGCAVSGDSRNIASAINRLDRKGDVAGTRVVRNVVAAVFEGAKIKKSKDKKSVVLIMKEAVLNDGALDRLESAAVDQLSIRDALVKRVKGDVEKAPVDLPKKMAAVLKLMEKEGFSKAAVIAAMQAA
jgi:hypothetical protein